MSDLISRQDAIDALAEEWYHDVEDYRTAVSVVGNLPSAQPELIEKVAYIRGFKQGRTQGMIDAKEEETAQSEIIRCKDCKHYQGDDSWLHCNRVTWINGEDDFCSRAERKDNG